MAVKLPSVPFLGFPLRPHANGQWYKSVWNSRTQRTEHFYFGPWRDDPLGERALNDPQSGWLARRPGIKAGTDNVRVSIVQNVLTLGELMSRFLVFKRGLVLAGDLSARTLGDYIQEIEGFVAFLKPATPIEALKPEHFTAYMHYMVEDRKLGRHARRRVRAYICAFLRYGAKNGWFTMPSTGAEWTAPPVDPDSIRRAKLRAGKKDFSNRIVTGEELDKLLARARPAFKAIILLGANCGLGPADIGRLRWDMIDMATGRICFPRPKTGVIRCNYLWKKTRKALLRVRSLRHNRVALAKEGESSLVFITRRGLPYYREREIHKVVEVNGVKVKKLAGIAIENAVSITFRRMAKELKLEGICFYRLRHSFKTLGKAARDKEALDLAMGHCDRSVGRVYDHEEVSWKRLKRVALAVHRKLWPVAKPSEDMTTPTSSKSHDGAAKPGPATAGPSQKLQDEKSIGGPQSRFDKSAASRRQHRSHEGALSG